MYNLYHPSSSSIPVHNAMSPQASVSPQQQQQQQQQQPHLFFTSPPPSSLSTAGEPLAQGQTYTLYRLTPAPPQPQQQQHPVQITSPFVSSADPQWLAWQHVRPSAASPAGPSLHHLMASSGGDTADHSVASGSYVSALLPAPPPASSGAATSTSYATAFIASADPPHSYSSPTAFTPLYLTGVADSRRTSYNVSSGTHHVDSSTDSAALYHALPPPCPPLPPAQQQQYGPAPRQRLVSLDGVALRTPPPHSLSIPTQSAKESTLEPSTTFLHTLGLALAQSTAPAVSQPGPAPHLAHPSGASHGMRAAGNVQLATASPMYTTSSTRHVDASAEDTRRPFPSAYAAFVEGGDVDAHQRHVHQHQHPPQQQQQPQRASLTSQNISTADYARPLLPRWERANSSSGAVNAFSNRPSLTSASLPSRRPTRVSMTSLNSAVLTNSVNDSRVPPPPPHHRDSGSTVGHVARVRPLLPFDGEDTKRQPPHHSRHQHLPLYQEQPQPQQQQQQQLQHQFAIAATHSRESSLSNVSPPQTPSKGVARRNRDKAVLFVGQLNYEATEADVTQVFACYGKPLSVVVLKDKGKASRRGGGGGGGGGNGGPASQRKVGGSAFVTYGSTLEADTAIMALHGRYNAKEDDNDKDDEAKFLQVSYGQQTGLISAFGAQHAQRLHASKPENPIPLIVLEQGQGTAVERSQVA